MYAIPANQSIDIYLYSLLLKIQIKSSYNEVRSVKIYGIGFGFD